MDQIMSVVIERTIKISVPDSLLTPAALAEFSKLIFPVFTAEDLFKHIASQVGARGSCFIEGVGRATVKEMSDYGAEPVVIFSIEEDSIESDVVTPAPVPDVLREG